MTTPGTSGNEQQLVPNDNTTPLEDLPEVDESELDPLTMTDVEGTNLEGD